MVTTGGPFPQMRCPDHNNSVWSSSLLDFVVYLVPFKRGMERMVEGLTSR